MTPLLPREAGLIERGSSLQSDRSTEALGHALLPSRYALPLRSLGTRHVAVARA